MDISDIKEKILIATESMDTLLTFLERKLDNGDILILDQTEYSLLYTFCDDCCTAMIGNASLTDRISWLESLKLDGIEKKEPIQVKLPDVSHMQWLMVPKEKTENFGAQLEVLLDDIHSLDISKSETEEPSTVNYGFESKQSPSLSDCSSMEILEYDEDDTQRTFNSEKTGKFEVQLDVLLDDIQSLDISESEEPLNMLYGFERTHSPSLSDCSSIEIIEYDEDDTQRTLNPENPTYHCLGNENNNKKTGLPNERKGLRTLKEIAEYMECVNGRHKPKENNENNQVVNMLQNMSIMMYTASIDLLNESTREKLPRSSNDFYPSDTLMSPIKIDRT